MRILVVGNCQTNTLAQMLQVLLLKAQVTRLDIADAIAEGPDARGFDHVLVQAHPRLSNYWADIQAAVPHGQQIPNLVFAGYHPDMVTLKGVSDKGLTVPVSGIALGAYWSGLDERACAGLFAPGFVARLGYERIFEIGRREFIKSLDAAGMPGRHLFEKWHLRAPFMLNTAHPKMFVIEDLARMLCRRMGLVPRQVDPTQMVVNQGRRGNIFPTYNHAPDIGNAMTSVGATYHMGLKAMDLAAFVRHCYAVLPDVMDKVRLPMDRLTRFRDALAADAEAAKSASMRRVNPYASRPRSSFWASSVAEVAPAEVAPVIAPLPVIEPASRVATAGSCFAQHISKTLTAHGLNYYVAEPAPAGMSRDAAHDLRYGMFSARYGNVYTARQLLQLMRMARGEFAPIETVWRARSGRMIDAFRPNVGEEFDSAADLLSARRAHLEKVREMFENMNVFVFTLGLTEAWTHAVDGAVYPVAPGVVSEHDDYTRYRFKNFSVDETVDDMVAFLGHLAELNRRARVILTVSPVPLVATYEDEHVLSATTYSKSVLRTVAQTLARGFSAVHYFPSYEIITGNYSGARYYDTDLRSVCQDGVDHVMRVFMRTLVAGSDDHSTESPTGGEPDDAGVLDEIRANSDIVCDEELISQRR